MPNKIYLAGKITGTKGYKRVFNSYEEILKEEYANAEIVNPVRLCADIPITAKHEIFMERCLKELATCDAIYFIPGWKKSKGAKMELKRASRLGLQIIIG